MAWKKHDFDNVPDRRCSDSEKWGKYALQQRDS